MPRPRFILLRLLALLLACLTASAGAELRTYVLNTLNGDGVAEVVRSLLPEGGTVVPYQGRLVVRTTAENYAEIVAMLAEIDAPPRSLRVSLRRTEDSQRQQNAIQSSGSMHYPGGLQGNVRIIRGQESGSSSQHYSITTLDGHEAFIDRGSLIAITGRWPADTTLLPLLQGIEVTPRQQPDGDIRLQVRQRHDARQADGEIALQRTSTTLIVPPGQWRSLGHINSSEAARQRAPGNRSDSRQGTDIPLQIRVDVLD